MLNRYGFVAMHDHALTLVNYLFIHIFNSEFFRQKDNNKLGVIRMTNVVRNNLSEQIIDRKFSSRTLLELFPLYRLLSLNKNS